MHPLFFQFSFHFNLCNHLPPSSEEYQETQFQLHLVLVLLLKVISFKEMFLSTGHFMTINISCFNVLFLVSKPVRTTKLESPASALDCHELPI